MLKTKLADVFQVNEYVKYLIHAALNIEMG